MKYKSGDYVKMIRKKDGKYDIYKIISPPEYFNMYPLERVVNNIKLWDDRYEENTMLLENNEYYKFKKLTKDEIMVELI